MPSGSARMRGDPRRNFLAEQHTAATWLGSLPDDDLDGVRFAQIVRDSFHSARVAPDRPKSSNACAPPASSRRRRWWSKSRRLTHRVPTLLWLVPKASRNSCRRLLSEFLVQSAWLPKRVRSVTAARAFFAIPFERVAADRGAEEQEIVEMRKLALRAEPRGYRICRWRPPGGFPRRENSSKVADGRGGVWIQRSCPRPSVRSGVVEMKMIELARGAVTAERGRFDSAIQSGRTRAIFRAQPCGSRPIPFRRSPHPD